MLDRFEVKLMRRELSRLLKEKHRVPFVKKELTTQIELIRTVLLSNNG